MVSLYAKDIEEAVLGAIMIEKSAFGTVAEILLSSIVFRLRRRRCAKHNNSNFITQKLPDFIVKRRLALADDALNTHPHPSNGLI